MMAVVTTGNGGYDRLAYRRVPIPEPRAGEVLLRVLAAGVNNTEINTRVGWYASSVTTDTASAAVGEESSPSARTASGWNAPTPFPIIQGTDCCGRVVAVGPDVTGRLVGKRVLVRPCMRLRGFASRETVWMGSDFDGAFAEFVRVPESEVFPIESPWSDAELGTLPCAYGTAENMLHRAGVGTGETVLITGASGGVGSAAVQLAKRRGAVVVAIAGKAKHDAVLAIGAGRVLDRIDDPVMVLGEQTIDVIVDNVVGTGIGTLLRCMKRGARYVSSGAIGGPLVTLDMRTVYLKDLTLMGCTAWDEPVFANLVRYVESSEIRPLLAATYPLAQIAEAQRDFLEKRHVGKLVLIPPAPQAR